MARWLTLAVVLAGCPGNTTEYNGENMLAFFPFSELESNEWVFLNEDSLVPYRLIGRIENVDIGADRIEYTVEYTKACYNDGVDGCATGDFVRSMTWSVQGPQGVHLHEAIAQLGAPLALDPSIRFANSQMKAGQVIESVSGGSTYSSTFVGIGDCPVRIAEWNNCGQVQLDGSAGPDAVTGTYWLQANLAVVAMKWDDQPTRWELSTIRTIE